MAYKVTGVGLQPLSVEQPDLDGAASIASKMEDQGVRDVRIFDPSGQEVSRKDWEAAWWRRANQAG